MERAHSWHWSVLQRRLSARDFLADRHSWPLDWERRPARVDLSRHCRDDRLQPREEEEPARRTVHLGELNRSSGPRYAACTFSREANHDPGDQLMGRLDRAEAHRASPSEISEMRTSLSRRLASRVSIFEIVCLVLGVAVLAWLISDKLGAARDQRNWAGELEARLAARQSLNGVAPVARTTSASNPRPVGTAGTTSGIIGRLEAHRLGISVITREGTDASTMERAIGHIANTALPGEAGNAAFAGHRDTFFRRLRYVRAGDRIIVTTVSGRHAYVVRDTGVVYRK